MGQAAQQALSCGGKNSTTSRFGAYGTGSSGEGFADCTTAPCEAAKKRFQHSEPTWVSCHSWEPTRLDTNNPYDCGGCGVSDRDKKPVETWALQEDERAQSREGIPLETAALNRFDCRLPAGYDRYEVSRATYTKKPLGLAPPAGLKKPSISMPAGGQAQFGGLPPTTTFLGFSVGSGTLLSAAVTSSDQKRMIRFDGDLDLPVPIRGKWASAPTISVRTKVVNVAQSAKVSEQIPSAHEVPPVRSNGQLLRWDGNGWVPSAEEEVAPTMLPEEASTTCPSTTTSRAAADTSRYLSAQLEVPNP